MKIRFLADADFNADIVAAVLRREPVVDFKTANEAGLQGLDDVQVLALAAREGRILVTHDRKTMPRHFAKFVEEQVCPGVLVVSNKASIHSVAEDLLLIWLASEAEEWKNLICAVPL
ncbi:MAG TPA: DUF5615 family PIN-like protein [Terriglobia bacterium]|nr:DUF5615 family PIN-like protein [Terriglobia bacterium]